MSNLLQEQSVDKAKGMGVLGDARKAPAPAQVAAGYQGLPARIEIPAGARRGYFSRQLLATDVPRRVIVLLASSRLVALLTWATTLLAIGLALLWRNDLVQCARDGVARLRAPLPAGAAPARKG
jgi:hypothetical protein